MPFLVPMFDRLLSGACDPTLRPIHAFRAAKSDYSHTIEISASRGAGIWAIQDRANQVPYHGPYQEPVKWLSRRLLPDR